MKQRASGVLLHISSLPSPYGIGDLGPWAHRFADFLAETRQRYWQLLPLNPTSAACGNSPYDSYSAFAGNPLLISPDLLVQDGILTHKDLDAAPSFSGERVDYKAVTQYKQELLNRAYQRCRSSLPTNRAFERFRHANADWLADYALFSALKDHFSGARWSDWPADVRDRRKALLCDWKTKLRERITREEFIQYLFFEQWSSLARYCHGRNVLIIGDLPIYVSHDSADVWANPQIFKLNGKKRPTVVAGVPPDYFSSTGQLWGNPVYHWEALKARRYRWWVSRMKHNLRCFDRVRMDHFRGFVAYWEIPANETTATAGRWVKGPDEDFFATLAEELPDLPIIAEDLGIITPDVRELMDRLGFPGMKILLFAFGADSDANPYLPHNYIRNCVVYTGTHDNNTAAGWFMSEAGPEERRNLFAYIGREVPQEEVHWELMKLALMSAADTAIIPMQDLLGLGAEARMNRPATVQGNWQWRLLAEQITSDIVARLSEMTELSRRASVLAQGAKR